ncbi:hypothetical protein ACFQLX_08850 [Streptomyces polyrhachis]|uniref:AAA+ ATPase domain-containing protein n=1 Tax=Streptomyces polyrhachis TaxID=1282885 RepID=A0ABW2GCF7_9ACTN
MGVIGRWAECQEVDRLLRRERLVAVTGPGGAGKSALAGEVVRRLAWQPRPQVRLVDFAALADPALVPRWLGYTLRGCRGGRRPVVLVVETCDRVAGATVETLAEMVREEPLLHALMTSRIPVDAPARVRLDPLPFDEILRIFHLSAPRRVDEGAEPVREICELLDGLPLAAQAAARRLGRSSAEELLALLSRPERALELGNGPEHGPERHRTLGDSLRWSLRLCTPGQRLLWARCSVFPGSFTLRDAQVVCTDERLGAEAAERAFEGLRLHQLLIGGGPAVRLPRDVRTYGRQRLSALGEEQEFQRRCLQWSLRPYAEVAD